MSTDFFHIWSFEHDAWWRPNGAGYTKSLWEAGMFRFDVAMQYCLEANFPNSINEALVPVVTKKEEEK